MQNQRITSEWLREQDLPLEQVKDFELKWPDGLELTEVNLLKLEWGLTCDWLASQILSSPAQEAYEKAIAPAREAHQRAITGAEEARTKARAPAWKAHQKAARRIAEAGSKALLRAYEAYERGTGPPITASTLEALHRPANASFLAYLLTKTPADEACDKAVASAWEAYHKATARALAAIIERQRGSA